MNRPPSTFFYWMEKRGDFISQHLSKNKDKISEWKKKKLESELKYIRRVLSELSESGRVTLTMTMTRDKENPEGGYRFSKFKYE